MDIQVVLNSFEAQPLNDEDGAANNLEDEAATFSIKYLTSSNLMGLELKDPSFRRHILVQCLILFDYLKPDARESLKSIPKNSQEGVIRTKTWKKVEVGIELEIQIVMDIWFVTRTEV